MRARTGTARKVPGIIVAGMTVTALLAGCTIGGGGDAPATENPTAIVESVDGWDPTEEVEWTDAQQILDDAGVDGERYHLGSKMNIPNPSGDRSWISSSEAALFMARIQEVADGRGEHDFIDRDTAQQALTYLTYGGAQKIAMYVGSSVQKTGDTGEGANDHGILYSAADPVAYGITTRFGIPMNELTDALLGQLPGRIAPLLPDYNRLDDDGKSVSPKDAVTWSADSDATAEPQYDETLEPDWFNPYRAS